MNKYTEISLKNAKKIMLDMLITFDKICKDNNLTYWLTAGTFLGAVRHKGFIPWDDDIDIAMPREDYEKLNTIVMPEHLFLQNKETDTSFKQYWSKIRYKDSLYVEYQEKDKVIDYHQGIFIDIFPVNYINSNYFFIYPLIQRFVGGVLSNRRFYARFFNRDLKLDAIKVMNLFNNKNNDIVIEGLDTLDNNLKDVKKEDIFPLQNIEFEGYNFFAPKNSDKYLKRFYGDTYMELPPEDKRQIHMYKIYIKNSN